MKWCLFLLILCLYLHSARLSDFDSDEDREVGVEGSELMHGSYEDELPEVHCKKCNLRLTPDHLAVIVKCYNCVDIVSPDKKTVSEYRKIYVF